MKQTPAMDFVQKRMRPGCLSRDGFLGVDTRSIVEIIEADEQQLRRLAVSPSNIAKRMRHFLDLGKEGLGDPIAIDGRFEVIVSSYKGRMACPFEHPGLYEKVVVSVRNLALSEELRYTALSIHLIEAHGFFQGHGSAYRIELQRLVDVLEVLSCE